MAVTGIRRYTMGFGANYRSTPRVVLRLDETAFDIVMEVENLSAAPMDLMYLCHVNFAYRQARESCSRFPSRPQHVVARTAIPSHVVPTPEYRAQIGRIRKAPGAPERVEHPRATIPSRSFISKGLSRARMAWSILCC